MKFETEPTERRAGSLDCINSILSSFEFVNFEEEEPVSEVLEEASKEWLIPQLDKSYTAYGETKQMELTHFDGYAMLDAIEFGAKWQKEQMMAKAKSGTVQKDNQVILDDGAYIDLDPSMQLKPSFVGLKEGDRIKVIVIKED